MSRPKPGMGRELRRTLGQAKAHISTPSPGAIQLAPIVSQYASTSRAIPSASAPNTLPITASDESNPFIAPLAHLSLIPQWDPPTAYFDPFAPAATIRDDIVIPYRPGRRIPPIPIPPPRASTMLAPKPFRITDSLRHSTQTRNYASSTAPALNANGSGSGSGTIDLQMPFPGISIPPSILSDTFSFTDTQSAWSFWTSSHPQAEPEVGLVPQQPPSPGPGTVKTRQTAEHTVFSTSAPAPTNSSSSHALLNHYVASFPDLRDTRTLHPPPDAKASSTYSSSLEFRIGATGLAKVRPPPTPPRSSPSGRERPPPPRTFPLEDIKAPTELSSVQVGEDAYFTRPDAMCIADGVGGWAKSGRGGANAARWSRLLTHFIREEIDLWWKGDAIYTEPIPSGGKGKKTWSETWRDSKTQEDDGLGLEEGMKRRKLDAVEIMQRGFEKCLSCVMSEVSYPFTAKGYELT
jgi:protein phosphatase PTC7